jgi:AraC-like DNA-binding protein
MFRWATYSTKRNAVTHSQTTMCSRTHVPYLRQMDRSTTHPMHRRCKALYTRQQIADRLGCSIGTVSRLQRSFLTPRQRAYLNAVGYVASFHPRRKSTPPVDPV